MGKGSNKLARLLICNGIDPTKAKILNVEQKNCAQQIIYVECEGVTYKIDELHKEIIDNKPESKWEVSKNDVKKPRGWHFRDVFVDSEGNVYHKGIEQKELKGTLSPTE